MHPPEPGLRGGAARQSGDPVLSQSNSSTADLADTASDLQAEKLRKLFCFCRATAYAIASLAFAGGPR